MVSDTVKKEEEIKDLQTVPPIGELKARVLRDNGYKSVEKLKEIDKEELAEIKEIGEKNAEEIIDGLESGEGEKRDEMFCPKCGVVVYTVDKECKECSQSLILTGKVFLQKGEMTDPLRTIAEYEKRLMDGEETPELYYGKAAVIEKMGVLDKALEMYDRVIELDPLYDHIWTAKASISLRLGKLKDAAKAYKVAVNKHQINLPEIPEEEEEEEREERAVSAREVEEKVGEARRGYFDLKSSDFPLDHLETKLKQAIEARNKDQREEAVKRAEELLELIEQVKEFMPKYEEMLEETSDIDNEEIQEMMEELIDSLSDGGFQEADELYSALMDALEEVEEEAVEEIEGVEEVEKAEEVVVPEEEIKEHEEEVVEKIEEAEEVVKEVKEEEEVTEDDFQKMFDKAKEELSKARAKRINIDDIKNLVRESVQAKKKEDYETGIDKAERALELSEEVNEIYELIVEGKEKVKQLREHKVDVKPFLSKLREGKELADDGEYDASKELYEQTIKDIDMVLEGGEVDIIDQEKEEVTEDSRIREVEEMLDILKMFEVDTGDAEGYIESAREDGDVDELLEKAREDIFEAIPDLVQRKIDGAKEELKEAKLSGADIDVPKCIHILKQARKAEKKEDFENALMHLKEYQDELKKE